MLSNWARWCSITEMCLSFHLVWWCWKHFLTWLINQKMSAEWWCQHPAMIRGVSFMPKNQINSSVNGSEAPSKYVASRNSIISRYNQSSRVLAQEVCAIYEFFDSESATFKVYLVVIYIVSSIPYTAASFFSWPYKWIYGLFLSYHE